LEFSKPAIKSMVMMVNFKAWSTQMDWFIAFWTLTSITFHMDKWNDCQWNRNVWDCRATSASVEWNIAVENIVVVNESWMTSWCNSTEHEHMLWRSFQAFLLSHGRWFKSNVSQIDWHCLNYFFLRSSWNTFVIFTFNKIPCLRVTMMIVSTCFDSEVLWDLKFNYSDVQLALRIINSHVSHCSFIGIEDILTELCLKSACSLIHTTPLCQSNLLSDVFILFELNWWLMNSQ